MPPATRTSGENPSDHPGRLVRQLLDERGWTVEHLADITGFGRQHLSGLLSGKVGISPDMAVALGAAFGNEPADWMRWNVAHQLSLVQTDVADLQRRIELFNRAPIRDMQRRGWLQETDDVAQIESELQQFFAATTMASFVSRLSGGMRRLHSRHRNVRGASKPIGWLWTFHSSHPSTANV